MNLDEHDPVTDGDLDDLPQAGARQWRGVIAEYRPLLDLIPDDLEPVTLREGGTPLVHSAWLSERTDGDVWLKVEGDNPTGSFKDRGMTAAISVARHDGAQAVVCASTGNTSASMSAYAARAGPDADRADARGQDRGRQDGAGDRARRADRDGARQLRPLPRAGQAALVELPRLPRELRQPGPDPGPEDRGVRDRRLPR